VIRKTARLASYYQSKWYVLYVQIPDEDQNNISLARQRHLINNFKTATEMGGEVIQVKSKRVTESILKVAEEKHITTVCIGKPHFHLWRIILRTALFSQLLNRLSNSDTDLIILS
jgi:two-component system, OmpR family, sensor histidine kinase KdpD